MAEMTENLTTSGCAAACVIALPSSPVYAIVNPVRQVAIIDE
jgi:hypothetical protein